MSDPAEDGPEWNRWTCHRCDVTGRNDDNSYLDHSFGPHNGHFPCVEHWTACEECGKRLDPSSKHSLCFACKIRHIGVVVPKGFHD